MIKHTLRRRAQSGFTLIEAAIVLAIIGLVAGGIWVAASSVYENLRTARASEQLLASVQQIRSLHATQGTISTASTLTEDLAKARVFPQDMFADAADVTPANPWQGDVFIFGVAAITGNLGPGFWVVYNGLPKSSCIDMVARNTGQGRDTGMVGVNIGSSAVSAAPAGLGSTTAPVTVTAAAQACSADTNNSVGFLFRLKG